RGGKCDAAAPAVVTARYAGSDRKIVCRFPSQHCFGKKGGVGFVDIDDAGGERAAAVFTLPFVSRAECQLQIRAQGVSDFAINRGAGGFVVKSPHVAE